MQITLIINEVNLMKQLHPILGVVILRVTLGIVMLAHSVYLKLFIFTLSGTEAFFVSIGLPGFLAYLVFGIEAIAGIALIIGFKVNITAGLLIPILLGATWAHWQAGWLFTNKGGGWEYPLVLCLMALSLVFMQNEKPQINTQAT